MIKQLKLSPRRLCVAALCAVSIGGVLAASASAADIRTGTLACPAGQQVSIVSHARGEVTHSYAEGPEHLGYPIYRQHYSHTLFEVDLTKTGLQGVMWQVTADSIGDVYVVCEP